MYLLMDSQNRFLNYEGGWGDMREARVVEPVLVPSLLKQHKNTAAIAVSTPQRRNTVKW